MLSIPFPQIVVDQSGEIKFLAMKYLGWFAITFNTNLNVYFLKSQDGVEYDNFYLFSIVNV